MMNKVIFEPKIKRVYIVMFAIALFLIGGFLNFQYKQFNLIHNNQIKSFQRVVGNLVKEYPEEESNIVNALLFNDSSNNSEKLGEEILNKYGYNLKIKMSEDPIFRSYKNSYMINNIITLTIIMVIIGFIMIFFIKYIFGYLGRISNILDKFISGDLNYKDEFNDEGIVSIISSQLSQLGRNISFNYTKLEEEKESSKALVTDISHQLKTPLASISMCNSILEENELTLEEKKEFFEMSNKNINKLHSLIDSLVNISRLEVAMIRLKPEYNNLTNTIIRAYNSAYIKANNKKINIKLGEIKEDIVVKHDTKWTEEAIFNVLENGIKYTNEGGKIYLDIEESLNYIKILIKDNGRGINKKEFNNIFKRFYRCKNVEQDHIEGSGVGLYLTRKILEDQGGSIMVKSVEGQGSEFTLLLPKN